MSYRLSTGLRRRVEGTGLLLLLGMLVLTLGCSKQPEYTPPPLQEQSVVIPLASLKPGELMFYTYEDKGRKISFFVFSHDGAVHSFFDACDSCYPEKKGYRAEQGAIVCRACGERYRIENIKDGFGSCFPVRLPGETVGDSYRIAVGSITERGYMF